MMATVGNDKAVCLGVTLFAKTLHRFLSTSYVHPVVLAVEEAHWHLESFNTVHHGSTSVCSRCQDVCKAVFAGSLAEEDALAVSVERSQLVVGQSTESSRGVSTGKHGTKEERSTQNAKRRYVLLPKEAEDGSDAL